MICEEYWACALDVVCSMMRFQNITHKTSVLVVWTNINELSLVASGEK